MATASSEARRVTAADNHYSVLGVAPGATPAQLREAWLAAARRLHPDRCARPDAHDLMSRVNGAYAALSDPEKRRKYDAVNKFKVCPTCKGTGQVYKQEGFRKKVARLCSICGGNGGL